MNLKNNSEMIKNNGLNERKLSVESRGVGNKNSVLSNGKPFTTGSVLSEKKRN